MTKEEILAMEAGEKLDSLVATEIFGWNRAYKAIGKFNRKIYRIGRFSTDISAAWQVVEKMRESDTYNFEKLKQKPGDRKGQYDDTFVDFCSQLMEVLGIAIEEFSYGATLSIMRKLYPEAICKAALLSKLE